MTDRELQARAAEELRAAGFIVQEEVALVAAGKRGARQRADLLAWAPAGDTFAPVAVVEVKSRHFDSDVVLDQIAGYQNLTGASHALVYDGQWFEAAPLEGGLARFDLRRIEPRSSLPQAGDAALRRAVELELHSILTESKGRAGDVGELSAALLGVLGSGGSGSELIAQLVTSEPGRSVVLDSVRSQLARLARPLEQNTTATELNNVLARLLDADEGSVLDPFCGTGDTLRSVARSSDRLDLVGADVQEEVIGLARLLNELAGVSMTLSVSDSLESDDLRCRYVVSDPPLGLRLPDPVQLTDGSFTRDGDCAVLDRCWRALEPGGRAVVVTTPGFLFRRGDAQRLRNRLSSDARLVAVLRLPPGTHGGTRLAPVLVVFEAGQPDETLFATVGADWRQQLSDRGALLSAYLEHRDRSR